MIVLQKKTLAFLLIAVLFLCGMAILCFFLFRETPERAVKRTWNEIVSALEKKGKEGVVVQMDKAKTVSRKCTEKLNVCLPRYRVAVMKRSDVIHALLTIRKMAAAISVSLYDMTLCFNEDKTVCTVQFTGSVDAVGENRRTFHEVQEFETELVLEDGNWLLRKVAFRQVISR